MFTGYSEASLQLLTEIGANDRDWFADHKKRYVTELADPTKSLVTALGERLQDRSYPGITYQPKTNGSIAPINNDLRFRPDSPPYKDHLLLKFWQGANKKTAPTLFVRVAQDSVGFAVGCAFTDVSAWRQLVDGEGGVELAEAIRAAQTSHPDVEIVGAELKRVPKPYAEDHPRGELLKHKYLQLRWPEPTPKSIHSEAFVDFCSDRLESLAALHKALLPLA